MSSDPKELVDCLAAEKAFWERDYARAVPRLEQLASEGQHAAALVLAQAYQYGMGVPQDSAKCVAFYRKAVDLGNGFAAMMLSMSYRSTGDTNPPDLRNHLPHDPAKADRYARMARKLFEPLVEKNDPAATQGLANMYEFGLIEPYDARQALELYKKAYELGSTFAANNIAGMLYDSDDPEFRNVEEARHWYELARKHGVLKIGIEEFGLPDEDPKP